MLNFSNLFTTLGAIIYITNIKEIILQSLWKKFWLVNATFTEKCNVIGVTYGYEIFNMQDMLYIMYICMAS